MARKKKPPPGKTRRLEPLSLSPLTPEETLKAFMQADPAKVEQRIKQKKG